MAIMDTRQMNRMRQEAIRRSQEMHKRSMVSSSHYSQGSTSAGDLPPKQSRTESDKSEIRSGSAGIEYRKDSQLSEFVDSIFQGKLDSDKLMILLLMIILIKEGADLKLILALGYILL